MFYFGRISEGKVPMNPGGEPTGVASACWLERARELVPVWWLAPKNARRAAEREREREFVWLELSLYRTSTKCRSGRFDKKYPSATFCVGLNPVESFLRLLATGRHL